MKVEVRKLNTLTAHRDAVYRVTAGDLGSFFSAGADGTVLLWTTHNFSEARMIAKVKNSVYALTYDAERSWLYVGVNFEGIYCIDVKLKEEVFFAPIAETSIYDIKVSQDTLFAGTANGQLIVFSATTGKQEDAWKLCEKSIRKIAVKPEGDTLAVGLSDNTIRIFDIASRKQTKKIEAHGNSVFALRYTPDGQNLLSAGRDAHLKIWDPVKYELVEDIVAHMYSIYDIAFSPDGEYFVTCSMDKSIKVWNRSWKLLKVIDKGRHAGHGTSVNSLLWVGPRQFVSGSDDRSIAVWEIEID